MSIPLDRLYHYIESVAQDVRGGNVLIYRFAPHGSKKLEDLSSLHVNLYNWTNCQLLPQIYCHDQEPLNYTHYQSNLSITDEEYFLKNTRTIPSNLRRDRFNVYDKCILLHSELNSQEVAVYQDNGFVPVYYWSHALIALDWFRYAQHQLQTKKAKKRFLIYNRAWSGTREYRLKFIDLLIKHNLITECQTSCNSIEPELQIHYSQHQYIDPQWKPEYCLEDYVNPTQATSCSSADFDLDDYNHTDFEIVLETLFDDSRVHLTEKILRPIACGQPFLILGTAGSLKYLQTYGFKTFGNIIDESYDVLTTAKDRMQSIINTMSTISKWTSQERTSNMIEINRIAKYNQQHFFSNNFADLVIGELKQNLMQGLDTLEKTNTSNRFLSLRKKLSANENCKKLLIQDSNLRSRQDIVQVLKQARIYYNRYLKTLNK